MGVAAGKEGEEINSNWCVYARWRGERKKERRKEGKRKEKERKSNMLPWVMIMIESNSISSSFSSLFSVSLFLCFVSLFLCFFILFALFLALCPSPSLPAHTFRSATGSAFSLLHQTGGKNAYLPPLRNKRYMYLSAPFHFIIPSYSTALLLLIPATIPPPPRRLGPPWLPPLPSSPAP